MKILIACEESQTVCKAFRALGHEAYSCDILPCSGGHPEWHLQSDVFKHLDEEWDLIIAHPPCTFLSRAGTRWLFPGGVLNQERFSKGMEARAFFEKILSAKAPRIAIENPVPHKVFGMPTHTQIIQPWQFGHRAQKTTLLWLKGLPPLQATEIVDAGEYYIDKKHGWRHTKWFMDEFGNSKARSKTFEGIAKAMAEQWGAA